MAKFDVKADKSKNRIYVRIEGSLTIDEAGRLKNAYEEAVNECKPGFTVLNDVSELRPCISEVQKTLTEITEIASRYGVGKVARIVGDTPIAGLQIERISKSKSHYHGEAFKTVEAAEAYLDEKKSESD
ncbi:MAG: hypothetical protein R6V04_09880 [bacterium]